MWRRIPDTLRCIGIIRQATESDVKAICELGQTVPEFSVNEATIHFWPQEIIRAAIHSNEAIVFVADEATNIQGLIIGNCNKAFKKVIIENIYVSPSARNSGIGERLLSHLITLAKKEGYEYISTLIPPEVNGAMRLYTNSGFNKGEVFQWLDKPLTNSFKSMPE